MRCQRPVERTQRPPLPTSGAAGPLCRPNAEPTACRRADSSACDVLLARPFRHHRAGGGRGLGTVGEGGAAEHGRGDDKRRESPIRAVGRLHSLFVGSPPRRLDHWL